MTIASKLETINDSLSDIKTAIIAKGQTPSGDITTYATAIGNISGGSGPVISPLSVTPTTSSQTITAPSGTDGYSPISVSAVTSSIDNNITAGNIISGVSILGVSGSAVKLVGETKNVSLTDKNGQTFVPSSGKNAITSITVTPNNQARTVTPTTSQQSLTVNSGYSGNGTITVNAVTSSIDSNIVAGNIKNGVSILGVTGSYEGSGGGSTLGFIFVNHYPSTSTGAEIYLCEGKLYAFDSSAVVTKQLKQIKEFSASTRQKLAIHYWEVQPNTTYSLWYYEGDTSGTYRWIEDIVMSTTSQADIGKYTESTGGSGGSPK